jgi:hypothetical protein
LVLVLEEGGGGERGVGVVLLCECFGVVCDVTLGIVALVVGDCMRALLHGAFGFWLHFWSVSGLG